MSAERQYTDEIHKELGYLATWLPGTSLEVGDCGPIEDHVFARARTVRDFGFALEAGPEGVPVDVDFTSRSGVQFEVQLEGENKQLPNVPAGQAGIQINFSRERAVVLQLSDAVSHTIADIHQLKQDVLALAWRGDGKWPMNYAVVSEVLVAAGGTVLISDASESTLAVTAEADLRAGLVDLANVSAGLTVTAKRNVGTALIAAPGARLLFKAFKIKDSWWSGRDVHDLAEIADVEVGADESPFEWINRPDAAPEGASFKARS